ncbi:MAG: alpha/beta hydrolase [Thiotrichaceae bacterium]|nr:alpha/beta hydrolase [Thiotrichaceae bacterium]
MKNKLFKVLVLSVISICFCSSIQAEEVTQKFNGLTLNANLEMADSKDYKDGMVLIIHGYLAHNKMEIIRTSQQTLLDNDWSSLAINLSLGIDNRHGFYDCTWPHRHLQENAVKELAAWAGWLRDKGVSKITLLAHSRGANEAMVYVVEQKDPEVTHLVMLAPGAGENVKIMYQERYGKTLDQTLSLAHKQIAAGKGSELMQDIDLMSCARTKVTADTFISYYAEGNKFRQFKFYLPKISIPALIVTGTSDERQPNIVELLSPVVDGKRTQISVVEGAGHFFRDLNMEEAMESLIEFIDE